MRILGFSILATLIATSSLRAEPAAEQQVREAINAPDLTVVHLWAPWCSNCEAELKSGGWLKMAKENPKTKFIFVSVWNNGNEGRAMLEKFGLTNQANVTITADPGPRTGDSKIKQFAGLPLSWIPTTWVYKGGDLRYALNYGKCAFPCLNSSWQTASRSGRIKANRNWKNDDGNTFTQKRQGEIPFSGRRAAADSPAGASEWGGPI